MILSLSSKGVDQRPTTQGLERGLENNFRFYSGKRRYLSEISDV